MKKTVISEKRLPMGELFHRILIRRKHKDELFQYLFREKKELLELYNAVNRTSYTDAGQLTIYTMENVIYLGYKNDLSFIISGVLNLYEHQSTINPNMPLRGLLYFARQYEAYIRQNHCNIYGSSLVKVPLPQYIVFYNGTEDWTNGEDVRTLLLTDAFENPEQKDVTPCLECRATIYNINYGHNKELTARCRTLEGYSILISRIVDFRLRGYSRQRAVDEAVKSCIADNILEDFLTKHRAEVVGMLLEEFDMKEFLKMDRRDQYNAGREEGIAIGEQRGREEGITIGEQQGIAIGEQRGREEGITIGEQRGRREERLASIQIMLHAGLEEELLLEKGYSEEEIAAAKQL